MESSHGSTTAAVFLKKAAVLLMHTGRPCALINDCRC